jgi:glucokinase
LKNKAYIGVDFGGTKILTGAITEEGKVLIEPVIVPTLANEESEKIYKRVKDSINTIINEIDSRSFTFESIGLGVTGPIDMKKGIILECPQLPTMNFFPLRKKIEEDFSLPVYMNNDANCLLYGEALFGVGKGLNSIVGFTLGTGIGCATVMNKKILNGSTDSAGEIWPSPYKDGTIEDFVSGEGVSRIYKEICEKKVSCFSQKKSASEIASLAEKGDKDALKVWEEFGKHLAVAIAWSVNLIDPEIVILGGSISNAYKFFYSSMENNLRKHICPATAEKIKIVSAKLGLHAGFIGAASLGLPIM